MKLTSGQIGRLQEIGAYFDETTDFSTQEEREHCFKKLEKDQLKINRKILTDLQKKPQMSKLFALQFALTDMLIKEGFVQVTTPTVISKKFLQQMSIGEDNKLNEQVYWLSNNSCLRPMLAPNLYEISRNLLKIWKEPIRIFEIGSCFRKESKGSSHLSEFTMLNLVEWGTPLEERDMRIKTMAQKVMQTSGLEGYTFEKEDSVVYGTTIDVVRRGVELASGSMGPHILDTAWGINTSWVGLGFGLERLLMEKEDEKTIGRMGRSVSYLNGVRLNFK